MIFICRAKVISKKKKKKGQKTIHKKDQLTIERYNSAVKKLVQNLAKISSLF